MSYLLIFILGSIVGSFLNVVIFRLNSGEKIGNSRSHCPHCQHQLSAGELVPIASFLWQRGRCRHCRGKISWQYPLVELACGILFVLATYQLVGNLGIDLLFSDSRTLGHWLASLFFICFLVVIFVYDLRWMMILDKVTVPAMIAAFIINCWLGLDWKNLLVAGALGLGFFLLQYLISAGKWIGGGDLRMGLLMGLMLGWPKILVALFFAYVIGSLVALALVAVGRKSLKTAVPFGTFLAIGTLIALFWGEGVLNWYLNINL